MANSISQESNAYFTVSYEQIIQLLQDLTSQLVPEISPDDEDPYYRLLDILANIYEMLGLRLNIETREVHASTALLFRSLAIIAQSVDYRVRCAIPEKVTLTFTLESVATTDFTIPKGTQVSNQDNTIVFETIQDVTIAANILQVTVLGEQKEPVAAAVIGTTDGKPNQTISVVLNDDNFVIADNSIILTIAPDTYTPTETFFTTDFDDLIFQQRIGVERITEVVLGDGINGALPATGIDIFAEFDKTLGRDGRVESNELTNIITPLVPPDSRILSVTNIEKSDGGANIQTVNDLKRVIPNLRYTGERAVTETDFIRVTELHPTVAKAGVASAGQTTDIEIYIIPIAGGQPTQIALDSVTAFINDRKVIGYNVSVFGAGIVEVLIEADVTINSAFLQTETAQNLTSAIAEITDISKTDAPNRIGTGVIGTDDISSTARNVSGVDRFLITTLNIRPYARPLTEKTLDWDVVMLPLSNTTQSYRIKFTSTTDFQVSRDAFIVGNGTVGNAFDVESKADFTINQNYVLGDEWEFTLYSYLGNDVGTYSLAEPSYFNIDEANITLNVSGGIAT